MIRSRSLVGSKSFRKSSRSSTMSTPVAMASLISSRNASRLLAVTLVHMYEREGVEVAAGALSVIGLATLTRKRPQRVAFAAATGAAEVTAGARCEHACLAAWWVRACVCAARRGPMGLQREATWLSNPCNLPAIV